MANNNPDGIGETIKTVVYALLIAGLIRTLFFQPFWIPSGSMKSTLLIGDFMFVNKMAYGYSKYSCPFSMCPFSGRIFASEPERGDIIVFKHPTSKVDYIKRLIGLPGDTIQVKQGQLSLNGKEVPMERDGMFTETYAAQGPLKRTPRCSNGAVPLGGVCEKERFIETLPNGVKHAILNITESSGDNTFLYTVPEGHYFFMGDNRDNSVDSRFAQGSGGGVGFVPAELLVGRADRVIFSSAGARMLYFWTWRSDRFFKRLE
jgi:signal peptidase I